MRVIILIAVVLGIIRVIIGFTISPESFTWLNFYKDMAHVFIGGMGVLWFQNRRDLTRILLFWGLTTLEVVVAVVSRSV